MSIKNMDLLKRLPIWPVVVLFAGAVLAQACSRSGGSGGNELSGELAAGRDAAVRHCGTCHLPVEPALLDKETWKEQVLPVMAGYFGIEVWQKSQYFAGENAAMPIAEWMQIVAYYDSLAPARLEPARPPVAVQESWAEFQPVMPATDTTRLATTTLVAIDSASRSICTSSSEMPALMQWDSVFHKKSKMPLTSPAMHMLFGAEPVVTAVGEMRAYDVEQGALYGLSEKPFITGLRRPLHTATADFNRDGLTDYAISAFGHNQGGLYVYLQEKGGTFSRVAVREMAGATQSVTGDFNGDGWPDIIALFAHAQEGIWLFTNNQKGEFTEKPLLRFPPVYGSSSFQLTDFNGDGKPDILYTAGDNSDYSRILKPYHGVYIFANKGNFEFEQQWFYPVNGATKAMAADFDGDGDQDIVSIAFFADLLSNPAEKFLYFRNDGYSQGKPAFQPFAPPIARHGRWICMDVNDWDGDGSPDVVLGNYSKGFLNQEEVKADWNVYLPFLVLKNNQQTLK